MADPSLMLSSTGQAMVEEKEVDIVVSQAFAELLSQGQDFDPQVFRPDDGADDPSYYVERVRDFLEQEQIGTFSFETDLKQDDLTDDARAVLYRILEADDQVARIDADQWAFLNSHSWLGSQARRTIEAFERGGATVLEATKQIGIEMLEKVIPSEGRPRNVDAKLIARGGVKWLVVGGGTIGGGALGGIAGFFVGGPLGQWIGHAVGGAMGKRAAKTAVVAIDP